jgi:hypothetical protein
VIFIPSREKAREEQAVKEIQLKEKEQEAKSNELKVYADCEDESNDRAKVLLRSKIEIATRSGSEMPAGMKEASEKGMFLKDDYNEIYESCLRKHGIKY